jgi:hypothetical protein
MAFSLRSLTQIHADMFCDSLRWVVTRTEKTSRRLWRREVFVYEINVESKPY